MFGDVLYSVIFDYASFLSVCFFRASFCLRRGWGFLVLPCVCTILFFPFLPSGHPQATTKLLKSGLVSPRQCASAGLIFPLRFFFSSSYCHVEPQGTQEVGPAYMEKESTNMRTKEDLHEGFGRAFLLLVFKDTTTSTERLTCFPFSF